MKKKPEWSKPKLTVLIRGKQEERILQSCKSGANPLVDGPTAEAYCCYVRPIPLCNACSGFTES